MWHRSDPMKQHLRLHGLGFGLRELSETGNGASGMTQTRCFGAETEKKSSRYDDQTGINNIRGAFILLTRHMRPVLLMLLKQILLVEWENRFLCARQAVLAVCLSVMEVRRTYSI